MPELPGLQTLRSFFAAFDSFFDVLQAYDVVLPVVSATPRPIDPASEDLDWLTAYVGSSWCRIVAADVRYELPVGAMEIERSREAARSLWQRVFDFEETSDELPRYIAVRWYDGAGKLLYRRGDHTESRMSISRAFAKAGAEREKGRLWYCWPDIASNDIRNEYEEKRQSGLAREAYEGAARRYLDLLQSTLTLMTERRGVDMTKAFEDASDPSRVEAICRTLSFPERELLRGLSSIYHNMSTLQPHGEELIHISRNDASTRAEIIARGLGDEYRLGQVLLAQARLDRDDDPDRAKRILKELRDRVAWRRGKFMARQQLAVLDWELHERFRKNAPTVPTDHRASVETLVGAIQELFGLVDELQNRQRELGDLEALDIDVHAFTVREAQKLLRVLKGIDDESTQRRASALERRYVAELEQMVRAQKRVVKVAVYKHAHSLNVRPAFAELIRRALDERKVDKAFALVEESMARDVLDILASRKEIADERRFSPAVFHPPVDAKSPQADSEETATLPSLRHATTEKAVDLREQIVLRRRRFEERALVNPVEPAEPIPNLADFVKNFTCEQPVTVLRFFLEQDETEKFGVFRFHRGELSVIRDLSARESLVTLNRFIEDCERRRLPRTSMYRNRLAELGNLIWRELIGPALAGLDVDRDMAGQSLVFAPADRLFRLPLHLAIEPGARPIGLRLPAFFTTSCRALVMERRYAWRTAVVERLEHFGVVCTPHDRPNRAPFGADTLHVLTEETGAHVTWCGPACLESQFQHLHWVGEATSENVCVLLTENPRWLFAAGHGNFLKDGNEAYPYLILPQDPHGGIITPYDIAALPRPMSNNQLTVLAACLSGQGSHLDGGEVSGFIRALVAAGGGALGLTLWPVEDSMAAAVTQQVIRAILGIARRSSTDRQRVDLPELLRWASAQVSGDNDLGRMCSAACFALYV